MSRVIKPITIRQRAAIDLAVAYLIEARDRLKEADAPQTLKKVRAALKSAEGAQRHARRRPLKEPELPL